MAESKPTITRQEGEDEREGKQLPEESGGTTNCNNVRNNPSIIVNSQGIYSSSKLQIEVGL